MPRSDDRRAGQSRGTASYTYSVGGAGWEQPKHPLTSPTEIRDIAVALALLTIAIFFIFYVPDGRGALYYLIVSAVAVSAGFFAHEMSHKFVARRYGCWAEFRADYKMLLLAVVIAFFIGFLYAAPGAVWISGRITREQNGKISLAGPGTNMLIAAALAPLLFTGLLSESSAIYDLAATVFYFSAFLAAFNLIPYPPFDGLKIWSWNKGVYVASLLAAGSLFVLALTSLY
jgi:Zn-dependent protease